MRDKEQVEFVFISLHEKTAASVLLKLFISSNEWCHTIDAPSAWAELHFQII